MPRPQSTLRFGAATSDRVICGTANSLTGNLCTMLGWFMPTTLTNTRKYFGKYNGATDANRHEVQVRADGSIRSIVEAGATDTQYTSATGLAVANVWMFLAATFNTAAANTLKLRFFVGYIGVPVLEFSSTVTSEGSGSYYDNSADPFIIGNTQTSVNLSFQGLIGPVQVYNRELTIYELTRLWHNINTPILGLCGDWRLGSTGQQTVPDLAGFNGHGAVVGALPAPPLALPIIGEYA